jgi:hypothetical protein
MNFSTKTATGPTFDCTDELTFHLNSFTPVESFRSDSFAQRHGALVECRAQINRAEDTLVHDMMSMGASWADVGDLYGISRQAAHVKFRDRVGSFGTDD